MGTIHTFPTVKSDGFDPRSHLRYRRRHDVEIKAPKEHEELRRLLPYGMWTCEDGRQVLFDRRYRPLWQRRPGQRATVADPNEWVAWEKQEWLFNDANPPWRNEKTKSKCYKILEAWGVR
jgi:hypothetical protein